MSSHQHGGDYLDMVAKTLQNGRRLPGKFQAIPHKTGSDPVMDAVADNIEQLTGMRGGGGKKAVLWEDLKKLGIAENVNGRSRSLIRSGSSNGSGGNGGNVTIAGHKVEKPTQPKNFVVNSGFNVVTLTWDSAPYAGHAYTEIYQATSDNFGNAVRIDTTSSNIESIPIPPKGVFYFWIRFVNEKGDKSPLNNVHGTKGESAVDPKFYLDLMAKEFKKNPSILNLTPKSINLDLSRFADAKLVAGLDKLLAEAVLESSLTTDIQTSTRRIENKTLTATIRRDYYTSIKTDSVIAEAVQEVKSQIENPDGDSVMALVKSSFATKASLTEAISNFSQRLNSSISGVNAVLNRDYATNADLKKAISQSKTALSSAIKGVKSDLSTNYKTWSDTQTALSQLEQTLTSAINKGGDASNKLAKDIDAVKANIKKNYVTKTEKNTAISSVSQSLSSTISKATKKLSDDIAANKKAANAATAKVSKDITAKLTNDYFTKTETTQAISQAQSTLSSTINGVSSKVTNLTQTVASSSNGFKALWGVKTSIGDMKASVGLIARSKADKSVNGAFFTIRNADFRVVYDSDGQRVVPVFGTINNPNYRPGNGQPRKILSINTASIKVASIKDLVAGKIVADSIVANTTIQSPHVRAPEINDRHSNFWVSRSGHVECKDILIRARTSGSRMVINQDRLEVYEGNSLRVRLGRL